MLNVPEIRESKAKKTFFLKHGDLYIADGPTIVKTILGSCLSVVFFNRKIKLGAICHAQLPQRSDEPHHCFDHCPVRCLQDSPASNEFKYVTCSIRYLAKKFKTKGVNRSDIQVKLFGGANVLANQRKAITVGEKNIAVAREMIREYGFSLHSEKIGGAKGLSLLFYSDTGDVLVKEITKASS